MAENQVKTSVAAKELGCGLTRVAAAKRKLGITSRWVKVSVLRKFFDENPNFKASDVYHPAGCDCQECRDWVADGHQRRDFSNRKPPTRRAETVTG